MKISKYVFLERKMPQYVIYKADLDPTPELFSHLQKLGISNRKKALQDAVENKGGAFKPIFISGIGHTGQGYYDWIYALLFGNSICFWSYDLGVGPDRIQFGRCVGHPDTHSEDTKFKDPKYEVNSPKFKLDKENLRRITKLKKEMDREFILKISEDDEESIETKVDLKKYLNLFKKHKGGIYTSNWDDLDDLAGLSKAWHFTLFFKK